MRKSRRGGLQALGVDGWIINVMTALFDSDPTLCALREGQCLFGRFDLMRELGKGSTGVVWLASESGSGAWVALKILPKGLAQQAGVSVALREAVARVSGLQHIHLARVLELVEGEEGAAVVMEYVDGETLDQKAGQQGPEAVQAWLGPVVQALEYAHEQGVGPHGDLKASQVMVDKTGLIRVVDFGVSVALKEAWSNLGGAGGQTVAPFGVGGWSPQRLAGESLTVSDDLYALGAMVYQGVTGREPYGSENLVARMRGKAPAAMAAPGEGVVPAGWEEMVAGCLAKAPEARPQRVGEVGMQLLGKAGGAKPTRRDIWDDELEPEEPKPVSPVKRPEVKVAAKKVAPVKAEKVKKSGGGKAWLALVAGVMILLGAGAVYYQKVWVPEEASRVEAARLAEEEVERRRVEDAELAGLIATLEGVRPGGPRAELEAAEARLAAYGLTGPARHQAAAKASYEAVVAGWEADRERREDEALAVLGAGFEAIKPGVSRAELAAAESRLTAYLTLAPERHQEAARTWFAAVAATWEAARLEVARGGVRVTTEPPGAWVMVGALEAAGSPLTLREVRLGRHMVTVTHPGYEDFRGEVEVEEDDFAVLAVRLTRSTGTLALTTEPSGLAYALRGPEATNRGGRTPARLENLPTGEYELTVRREGFPEVVKRLRVERQVEASEQVEIVGGRVVVTSMPSGAEVYDMEGRKMGDTPWTLAERVPGPVEFEVRRVRYQPVKVRGEVRARGSLELNAKLELIPGPQPGVGWTVPELGIEMRPIAAGSFMMGSPTGGDSDERPVRRVTISRPYWLGKYEVTQAEWEAVMRTNPSRVRGARLPVEQVQWTEAMGFCRMLTERERAAGRLPSGYVYSLPTEAEWEYAARAGTTGDYGAPGRLEELGWFAVNAGGAPKPVGQKRANAWGLHDMHGNVAEWCLDWYGTYAGVAVTDPRGVATGSHRIHRGGGWATGAAQTRSAYRNLGLPEERNQFVGFRLALRPE